MGRGLFSVTIGVLWLTFGTTVTAESPQELLGFAEEAGSLQSRYDRMAWQSPEAVLAALQSKTDTVRLGALHLLGAEEQDAYELIHNKNADTQAVATPWQSELRYVALGDDAVQEAVLAVQVRNLVLIAIAAPRNGKWDRVAAFKCICPSNNTDDSYGSANGSDRRAHSCRAGENKCTVTRRWFYHYRFGPVSTIPGAIVVEAEGVAENRAHGVFRSDVEDRNLKFKSCSTMLFNEKTHQFEPSPPPPSSIDACGSFAQS